MRPFIYSIGYLYSVLRWRLVLAFCLLLTSTALEGFSIALFLPLIMGEDSDSPLYSLMIRLFDAAGLEYSIPLTLTLVAILYATRTLFIVLQELYVGRLLATLVAGIKTETLQQLLGVDYRYYMERGGASYFTNAVTVEFSNLSHAFSHVVDSIVRGSFCLLYVVLAVSIHPMLSLVFVLFLAPVLLFIRPLSGLVQRISNQNATNNAVVLSLLLQTVTAFKYLKATHRILGLRNTAIGAIRRQGDLVYRYQKVESLVRNGVDLATVLLVLAVLLFQIEFMGGDLVVLVFLLVVLRRVMQFASNTQTSFFAFLEHAGSVNVLRQTEADLKNHSEGQSSGQMPDFSQPIRISDVSVAFASPVLLGASLEFKPGSKTAIVGVSGSGKTTLVNLLTGLLRPDRGTVSIGGVPYDELDMFRLRSRIGYVTQEVPVFNDTLRNNVVMWHDDNVGQNAKLDRVLAVTGLTALVNSLPDGYDTSVGDFGTRLSGGQRQRVAIARELYREPSLLVMDEGTSALDRESESEIQDNINALYGQRTVVVITHRLSSVRDCDVIYVLKDGRVVESGDYEYLAGAGGEFSNMLMSATSEC